MIRTLQEKDREITLRFLADEPSINLFMIGDIENFGFDDPKQELWGAFNDSGELEGVLLRYRENYIPYFKSKDFDDSAFKEIIKTAEGSIFISGKESILENYKNIREGYKYRTTYFCELTTEELLLDNEIMESVKLATVEDANRIFDLLKQISEFSSSPIEVENIESKIKDGSGRIYYIEDNNGKMVTVAQTTAENSKSAMVVGVATLKEARGQGLMSACLSKLSRDVLAERQSICLFYDNPEAGKIYHRLGYKTIDNWVMINEKKE